MRVDAQRRNKKEEKRNETQPNADQAPGLVTQLGRLAAAETNGALLERFAEDRNCHALADGSAPAPAGLRR